MLCIVMRSYLERAKGCSAAVNRLCSKFLDRLNELLSLLFVLSFTHQLFLSLPNHIHDFLVGCCAKGRMF